MKLLNEHGREIFVLIMGDIDDPQIEEAYYPDNKDEVVSDEDIEYILAVYHEDMACLIEAQLEAYEDMEEFGLTGTEF